MIDAWENSLGKSVEVNQGESYLGKSMEVSQGVKRMNEQYVIECTDENISDELKAELGFVYDSFEDAEEDAERLSRKYPNNFSVRSLGG